MGKTNPKAGSEQKLSATIEDKDLKAAVEQLENALIDEKALHETTTEQLEVEKSEHKKTINALKDEQDAHKTKTELLDKANADFSALHDQTAEQFKVEKEKLDNALQEIEALKKVNAAGTTEAKADKSPAGSGMSDKDRTFKAEWGKGKDKKSGTFMLADTNKIYFEGKKLTAKEFMDNEEAQLAFARNGSPLVKKVK